MPGLPEAVAKIVATSTEDEKQVNHKKVREAFILALKKRLAEDAAFEQWRLLQEINDETESFEIGNGKEKFGIGFKEDGLSIQMGAVNEKSTDMMLATLSCYKQAHDKFHPKAELEFELVCNDEKEARMIIEKARAQNLNITTLKFYNYEKDTKTGKTLPNINKNDLLAKIMSEPLPANKAPLVVSKPGL